MVEHMESITSKICAYGRAFHSKNDKDKIFDDYLAMDLLTTDEQQYIRQLLLKYKKKEIGSKECCGSCCDCDICSDAVIGDILKSHLSAIPLSRSRYTEDMLKLAIENGARQYVILGAGLDTSAYRNSELLKGVQVFEVDHPSTQRHKKNRVKELEWETDGNVHYVAVDFSRDDLQSELISSGFDRNITTFVSFLGVTYYLTPIQLQKTLGDLSNILADKSTVVFDYPDETILNDEVSTNNINSMVGMVKELGETMVTGYNYYSICSILGSTDFILQEHLEPVEIEDRYFRDRTDGYHAFENINIVSAYVSK